MKIKLIDGKFHVVDSADNIKQTFETERAAQEFLESLKEEISDINITESTQIVQSDNKKGNSWEVVLFEFGQSKRYPHYHYNREAFDASVNVFDSAKVYANSEADDYGHKKQNKKIVRDIVGYLDKPYSTEKDARAKLVLLPSAKWLQENLQFAESNNKLNVYELSIQATGKARIKRDNGKATPWVESFAQADIDVVSRGAAGGKFVKLVESNKQGDKKMKQKLAILFSLLYPSFLESKGVEDWQLPDENELFTYLREADKASPVLKIPDGMTEPNEKWVDEKIKELRESVQPKPEPKKKPDPPQKIDDKQFQESLNRLDEDMKKLMKESCRNMLSVKLTESKLPEPVKQTIRKQYADKIFQEADVDSTIDEMRTLLGHLHKVTPNNRGADVNINVDEYDKFAASLSAFFLASGQSLNPVQPGSDEWKELIGEKVTPFKSLKEAYVMFTGDDQVTGKYDPSKRRFTESLGTADWANVLANTLNRRLVRDYSQMNLDTWRVFTDIVPLNDFKEQQRVRFGGYANLPTVGERQPYLPLTSPEDEKATYTPAKRGGTEDISLEMIKNDDVGSIQRIPTRMARAAAHTLHEFVFDFVNPAVNPTIYDSVVLYHDGSHGNLGTAALDATSLAAARLRMKKQTKAGANKRIGLRLRYLLVPPDLEKAAYDLITPAFNKSNQVPEFLQQLGIVPIVVDYWTVATDWAAVADRMDIVGLEIGFVDGRQEPEIVVSDLPNAGSWFTNDITTFKIRHIYGGAVIDYRAFDGTLV